MASKKQKIKANQNIKNFFNKLYISFPNVTKTPNKHDLIKKYDINYIYFSKDKDIWFAKRKNEEVFLFGKSNESNKILTPNNPLLIISFDKDSSYTDKFNGLIINNEIFIDEEYFIENYPDFKTKLEKRNIEIINKNVEVIVLGDYNNSNEFNINLKILLDELNQYTLIQEKIEIQKDDLEKTEEKNCEICNKNLKNTEKELCPKCSKKRYASKLLKKLLNFVDPEVEFNKNNLPKTHYNDIQINETIWTLQEVNLLDEHYEYCILKSQNTLDKFLKKYYTEKTAEKTPKENPKEEKTKKITKRCIVCENIFPTSKFYKSNKTEDGFEDYCKKCKKMVNTANYLKELLNYAEPGTTFKKDILPEDNNDFNGIQGKIWALEDYDLIKKNKDDENYILTDQEICKSFLNRYYIENKDKKIKPKVTPKKELSKKEQMKIVINAISNGKTNKEAAKLANIQIYNITHWYNQGKKEIGEDNIQFYNKYNKAMKEFELNSIKNLYVIESFNKKDELSIADSLRKQQMEIILTNLGKGKSKKNSAYTANITNETLQQWYKRGKNNLGAEYKEFYEKINIILSPIKTPNPEEATTSDKTLEIEEDLFEGILNLLPIKYTKYFKYESESGFAWVRKNQGQWVYKRKVSGIQQQLSRSNLYSLYLEIIKNDYIWGVRDLTKAKESLASCEKPDIKKLDAETIKKIKEKSHQILNTSNDSFKGILNKLPEKYEKIFRASKSPTGFAWVYKGPNTWIYTKIDEKEKIQITRNNLYILYKEVINQGQIWGVRDLKKAKKNLSLCEKPKLSQLHEIERNNKFETNENKTEESEKEDDLVILHEIKETSEQSETETNNEENLSREEVTCIIFDSKSFDRVIISGLIKTQDLMNTLYKFKPYENDMIKIITNNQNTQTEIFIELKIYKAKMNLFKEKIDQLGWKLIN